MSGQTELTPAEVLQRRADAVIAKVMADLKAQPKGKRQVKQQSGRAARKQANGRAWVQAVGGTTDLMKAIYSPAETELCVTTDHRRGMVDGKPFRSPAQGARSSGAQRGQ